MNAIAKTLCLMGATLILSQQSMAQQSNINLSYNPQKDTEGLVPFSASLNSPQVNDDRTVVFRVRAPKAEEVLLSGAMLTVMHEPKPMPFTKGDDGIWELKIGPLPVDMYQYNIIIDGVSMADPNNTCAAFTAMPPYSELIVHGDGPQWYDAKDVAHGSITRHIYHSPATDGEREMYVYTPPMYNPAKQYPVLYLMGGSGELPSNWMYDGRVNFIMDNLLAEGKAEPMIIAIVNNQVVHRNHPQHAELTFPIMKRELTEVIVPYVDSHYSTIRNPHGRALSGLSMGGRHTMYSGLTSLDTFANFGILSAGDHEAETTLADFLNDPQANDKIDYLFVGQGSEEQSNFFNVRVKGLVDALNAHGIEHEYYSGGHGGHDWSTWRHLLYYRFLPSLFKSPAFQQMLEAESDAYLENPEPVDFDGYDDDFWIYLCFGQSNFEGANKPEKFDYYGTDNFYMYATVDNDYDGRKRGNWYPAVPPFCVKTGGMSGADYFGRTLVRALPDKKIGVINVAVGGCKIELFDPEDNSEALAESADWLKAAASRYDDSQPYKHLLACARDAQKVGKIKGMLLHQGESNTGDTLWTQKVAKVYNALIRDLGLDPAETPLLAGELMRKDMNGSCWPHNAIIATLPEVVPNAHIVSSEGCVGSPYDHVHFFPAGYRKLGYNYASTYLTECLGFDPADVPAEIVAPLRARNHVWDGKYYTDYYPPLRIPGERFTPLAVGDTLSITYIVPETPRHDNPKILLKTSVSTADLADAEPISPDPTKPGTNTHELKVTEPMLKQLQDTGLEIGQPGVIITSIDIK